MSKIKVRRQKYGMAKVKFIQIQSIMAVLAGSELNPGWWNIKGLSWELLRQVSDAIESLEKSSATFEKMKQKLIDDYAEKDEAGQIVRIKDADGNLTGTPSFGENQRLVDEAWIELINTEFECPALQATLLERHAEPLGLTLATYGMIKPIVGE